MNKPELNVEMNFYTFTVLMSSAGLTTPWLEMIEGLKEDHEDITSISDHLPMTYLGFKNAPAGKGNHHAYIGGLVMHLIEMWGFWLTLKPQLPSDDPLLTDSNVMQAIILHDLHKAQTTFICNRKLPLENGEESKDYILEYGKHPSSSLLTNDQKSLYIATKHNIILDIYQWNSLFNSEGGYAKSPPKFSTSLAKLVYTLDELSSNVLARSSVGNCVDIRSVGFVSADLL
jgi:hypothetical protein